MLKAEDLKLYKRQVEEDISTHNSDLKANNDPEEIIKAFQGRFKDSEDTQNENYLFIAANTILPSLFFQLPRIIVRAKREGLEFEAAVLNSLANAYFGDEAKRENQQCILDAFLPYGYAVMKNGYNSRTGKVKGPSILTGTQKSRNKENDMEGDVEFLRYEKPLIIRQSPKTTYLDFSQPFGKGNRITFEYTRSLKELQDSNLYTLSQNFIQFFSGRSLNDDAREVNLRVFEHWRMIGEYAWKLVYVEGWPEEIFWGKTIYKNLPVSYLRFNDMGDILYTVSHGRPATNAQKELNYLNELWKKHLDNLRNQHLVDFSQLDETGVKTLRANVIGGIVGTKGPITGGIAQPLQSAMMDRNLFANIDNVRQYLNLIISSTGGKTGEDSKLATIERSKAMGDALRSSGMQDRIRDFVVDQIRQLIRNIIVLGNPEMMLKITGRNLVFPRTGERIESGTELQLGGEKGYALNDIITGDIDTDFVFDVDITSAQRPDFPVIRKQLAEGIALAAQLQPVLQQENSRVNFTELMKDYYSTFDAIPNADKYIENIPETERMPTMPMGMPGAGVPTEQSLEASAVKVPTGREGVGVV